MKKIFLEVADYECEVCGWAFSMAGEFDGRHGDIRTELHEDKQCEGIAKEVPNG